MTTKHRGNDLGSQNGEDMSRRDSTVIEDGKCTEHLVYFHNHSKQCIVSKAILLQADWPNINPPGSQNHDIQVATSVSHPLHPTPPPNGLRTLSRHHNVLAIPLRQPSSVVT
jgi:hypothetical protein